MAEDKIEKRIASVNLFVEEIMRLKNDSPAGNAEQWFFRGQKNANWDVRPSIFRGDNLTAEHVVIESAERQNPVEFRDCVNRFEILTKLQHYGLSTRLLDVTLNPLVALYFATEISSEYVKNKNGQFTYQEHDGKVYFRFVRGCSLKDLQARIALAIPFAEFGKSLSLEDFCKRLVDEKTISDSEFESLINNDYEKIINILQTNSFIASTNSNVRLIQQRGAFLIAPSVNIKTNTAVKTSLLSKARANLSSDFEGCFIVPSKDKEDIREELDFFNVNEATLFPELEHQMRYIQTQSKKNTVVGTVEEYSHYKRIISTRIRETINVNKSEIDSILRQILANVSETIRTEISGNILSEAKVIDWHKKESVISGLRRSIAKSIAENYSAVDAKSKADEIIAKLLEEE